MLNEEANHAALLLSYGRKDLAGTVIEKARKEAAKPYTERSGMCIDATTPIGQIARFYPAPSPCSNYSTSRVGSGVRPR